MHKNKSHLSVDLLPVADVDVHRNDAQVDECQRELLKVFDGFLVPAKVEFRMEIKWLLRHHSRKALGVFIDYTNLI
jgi:hypothetical protein